MAQQHPIFVDIDRGNLAEVQRRVVAGAAVLEERGGIYRTKPLMNAIQQRQPAIVLWLIEHRGHHDLSTRDNTGGTALHWACDRGPLSIVQALVEAGANPATLTQHGSTPLMWTAYHNHTDIVSFLLQLPAVKTFIDNINNYDIITALSIASANGQLSIVQLLLQAGADPTIPAGQDSPLNLAISASHHAIGALLRTTIAEPDRARVLHKARTLVDTAHKIRQIRLGNDNDDDENEQQQPRPRRTRGETQRRAVAAAPAYLRGHVEREQVLPQVELTRQHRQGNEQLRAMAAFALEGLPRELFVELLGFMLPVWADKGPEGQEA
jgi:ankyrin repeat protein